MSDADDNDQPASSVTPQSLAQALAEPYDASSHPQELLDLPGFEQGVGLLCDPGIPVERLIDHLTGPIHALAAMAAEALARREDGELALPAVWSFIGQAGAWTLFYLMRVLARHGREPLVARLMLAGGDWWPRNATLVRMLNNFVAARLQSGEQVQLQPLLTQSATFDADELDARLASLEDPPGAQLRAELKAWQRARVDVSFLNSIGRLWGEREDWEGSIVEHAALRTALEAAQHTVSGPTPRSLLVVGEAGVGKTTLVRALGTWLRRDGWHVFQASAADVNAGQSYLGELESRMRELVGHVAIDKRVIWYVPAFHELYYAGRHRYSPVGLLDLMLPSIERGEICVIGEIDPHALEKLLQLRPRLRQGMRMLNLDELSAPEAQTLAERYLASDATAGHLRHTPEVVREATELARQYLSNRALPGSLIELLRETVTPRRATSMMPTMPANSATLTRDDLIVTLARLTGLPASVLDDRAGLDPAGLRQFFRQRVMGQPEAVDCLVDRIAMLKAGLTDPGRPVGVFLFAGPTGTGKTEVAKSLAQFLFGAADRMIRLDMSEFQESGSMSRLVGDSGEDAEAAALTNRIRKQPFSVVLLDEFEKAHPRVWDLFLQVFDDGRLTDAQGNLADFRHSIIILTTNVGATEHQGASLGFTGGRGEFAEDQVTRAVSRTFRPEFVNRLDRVIVFRPLSKSVMRDILKKELAAILQRRGLRNREWAVEWEESAIDFLLDKGFTQDMGARPLRRAIDRYVLAPLAATIVEHRAPQGDQFLFVRGGAQALEVEFVDPDAAEAPAATLLAINDGDGDLDVRDMVLAPRGAQVESRWLQTALDHLAARLDDAPWRQEKDERLRQMQRDGFWNDPERHRILQRIECMDAIEASLASAQSLARRLEARAGRGAAPRVLVGNLAQQLYLLGAALRDFDAGESSDVYVGIESSAAQGGAGEALDWPAQLGRMYVGWGRKRHLRIQSLDAGGGRQVLAVSGLGARCILMAEIGLHVLESLDASGNAQRQTARVRVAPQPVLPSERGRTTLSAALGCLDAAAPEARIVRRYRSKPSPLVRDVAQGWRTGRLDQVLEGDFDLMRARGEDD